MWFTVLELAEGEFYIRQHTNRKEPVRTVFAGPHSPQTKVYNWDMHLYHEHLKSLKQYRLSDEYAEKLQDKVGMNLDLEEGRDFELYWEQGMEYTVAISKQESDRMQHQAEAYRKAHPEQFPCDFPDAEVDIIGYAQSAKEAQERQQAKDERRWQTLEELYMQEFNFPESRELFMAIFDWFKGKVNPNPNYFNHDGTAITNGQEVPDEPGTPTGSGERGGDGRGAEG